MLSFLMASLLTFGAPAAPVHPSTAVLMQERVPQTPAKPLPGQPGSSLPGLGDYAERETFAGDLEEFKGGSVGLIVLIVVVVAVLVLVSILIPW